MFAKSGNPTQTAFERKIRDFHWSTRPVWAPSSSSPSLPQELCFRHSSLPLYENPKLSLPSGLCRYGSFCWDPLGISYSSLSPTVLDLTHPSGLQSAAFSSWKTSWLCRPEWCLLWVLICLWLVLCLFWPLRGSANICFIDLLNFAMPPPTHFPYQQFPLIQPNSIVLQGVRILPPLGLPWGLQSFQLSHHLAQ